MGVVPESVARRVAGAVLEPPPLEAEFRASTRRQDGQAVAAVAALFVAVGLAFIWNDRQFATSDAAFWWLVGARLAAIGVSAAVAWTALRTTGYARLDGAALALIFACAALQAFVQSTRPADYYLPVAETGLGIVLAWVVLPNRFWLQALGGALVTAGGATWLLAFRQPLTPVGQWFALTTLFGLNTGAAIASYGLHRFRRLQFLAVRQAQDLAAELRSREASLAATLAENELLVAELREALGSVRTLSGLLPICMYCKKVRDDKGYWERIEKYISAHTDASFSHGLCPECLAEHYPRRD